MYKLVNQIEASSRQYIVIKIVNWKVNGKSLDKERV